jgi:hypothetical protein
MIIEIEGNALARLEKTDIKYRVIGKTGGGALKIRAGKEILLNIDIAKAAAIYEKTIPGLMDGCQ